MNYVACCHQNHQLINGTFYNNNYKRNSWNKVINNSTVCLETEDNKIMKIHECVMLRSIHLICSKFGLSPNPWSTPDGRSSHWWI